MLAPISLSALTLIAPCSITTFAPRASKPFICWSIGLAPIGHPPGSSTFAFLNLVNNAKGKGAPSDVMDLIDKLPDKTYTSPIDITKEIGKIE